MLGMSVQRSVRFPDELEAKMVELAERADRDFSYMVVRACEAYYLGKTKAGFPSVPSAVVQEAKALEPSPRAVKAAEVRSKRAPSIADTWRR